VQRKWGSIGRPIPGVEVRLVPVDGTDESDHHASERSGEIWVRGPIMSGYWRNRDESAAVLVDGWFRTGDVAEMDDEGFLKVVDRTKDVVRSGGHNVYSRQVEICLATHPAIAEAAVVGVADAFYEETVCAVVRLNDEWWGAAGKELADAIRAHVKEAIAGYNVPRRIVFVRTMPRSPIGKLLKAELRTRADAASDGAWLA
jgi:fatty-acyl-CoA synthase